MLLCMMQRRPNRIINILNMGNNNQNIISEACAMPPSGDSICDAEGWGQIHRSMLCYIAHYGMLPIVLVS